MIGITTTGYVKICYFHLRDKKCKAFPIILNSPEIHKNMRWKKLSFESLLEVVTQTDEVVSIVTSLKEQIESDDAPPKGTDPIGLLLNLVKSCEKRIQQLEQFYGDNDLHEKASVVEHQRLKLKRMLRSIDPIIENAKHEQKPRKAVTQLRISLTAQEFDELQSRRQALKDVNKQFLEKGSGNLSWENNTISTGHSKARQLGQAGLYSEGAWKDPTRFSHRPDQQQENWMTKQGFATLPTKQQSAYPSGSLVTGASAGPYLSSRADVVLLRPNEKHSFNSVVSTSR